MKNLVFIPVLLCFSACAVPQPGGGLSSKFLLANQAAQDSGQFIDEVLQINSDPAGARIQVNDAFAGNAPVSYTVRRYWRGQPGAMTLDMVKIEAIPTYQGECLQGGFYGQGNQKVPFPLSFRMANCSNAPSYRPALRKK